MTGSPLNALIICNGRPPSRWFLRRLAKESDWIVAADGGANTARRHGIRPDVIIGDMDSMTTATRRHFVGTVVLHINRQDNTDLEKALDLLVLKGIRKAVIVGATGGRVDFTLANFSVLWNYTPRMSIVVVGEGWRAMPVPGRLTLRVRRGTTVSLIPFGSCGGITLTGFRYSLRNASMKVGKIGVSNVVVRNPCTVTVRRGHMLMLILDHALAGA